MVWYIALISITSESSVLSTYIYKHAKWHTYTFCEWRIDKSNSRQTQCVLAPKIQWNDYNIQTWDVANLICRHSTLLFRLLFLAFGLKMPRSSVHWIKIVRCSEWYSELRYAASSVNTQVHCCISAPKSKRKLLKILFILFLFLDFELNFLSLTIFVRCSTLQSDNVDA